MFKRFSCLCLLLVLLSLILIIAPVLGADNDINEIPTVSLEAIQEILVNEGESAYSENEVKAYVKELIPLIEKHAGKKFVKVPQVKIIDRKGMTKILSEEFESQFKNMYSQASNEELHIMASKQAAAFSTTLLGKYSIFEKTVYLMPKNIKPLFTLLNVDQENLKPLIKVVIAHELTHALQNQEINLQKLFSLNNIDAMQAYNATIEGHAVFVSELVARELGIENAAIELARMLSAGAINIDDPLMDTVNKTVSAVYEEVYLGGKKFIEYHYQQGGNIRLWKILNTPPTRTSMIANPATYSFEQNKTKKLDYSAVFKEFNTQLTEEKWLTQNIEVGTMLLKAAFVKLDKVVQDELLNNIEHVQSLMAQKQDGQQTISVALIVFKSEGFGLKYLDITDNLMKNNVQELKASKMYDVKNYYFSNFTGIQSDAARRIHFEIVNKIDNSKTTQSVIRIIRGSVMLEFVYNDNLLTTDEVREIAVQLFSNYEMLQSSN